MKMNLFKKSSFVAALAATMIFASCSKDDDNFVAPGQGDVDMAYVSINVVTPQAQRTRAVESVETDASPAENATPSMYFLTFDEAGNIITYKDQKPATDFSTAKPEAFEISAKSKNILVIANPGTELQKVIAAANATTPTVTTFAQLNAAITGATETEISGGSGAFTMISANGLEAIANIYKPADYADQATESKTAADLAKEDAEKDANRQEINIERLAAKLDLTVADDAAITPSDAQFEYTGWVLDATNTTFFPYATKTELASKPSNSTFYANNFYTIDPNFTGYTGLAYKDASATFTTNAGPVYCIENTVDAAEQKYGNVTRIVIKGKYAPKGFTLGDDWFRMGDLAYKTIEAIVADYNKTTASADFKAVCDKFFATLKNATNDKAGTLSAVTSFADLTTALLTAYKAGSGNVVGNEATRVDNCIRWYVGSVCYYYHQIRHDDAVTEDMGYAKYGVVRNNWYSLTVTSIKGAGTPWYPNIDPKDPNPDKPKDEPKPEDPIDPTAGYVGLDIKVAPWVKWTTNIGI